MADASPADRLSSALDQMEQVPYVEDLSLDEQEQQERQLRDLTADIDLETLDANLAGRFFLRRGSLLAARLNHDAALADFLQASTSFEDAGNVPRTAESTYRRGLTHFDAGDLTAAADDFTLAADRWTESEDLWHVATARHALASVRMYQGEAEQARQIFQDVLRAREELNDADGILATRNNLATLAAENGHFSRARREYETIIEHLQKTNDRRGLAKARQNLGAIFVGMNKHDEAAEQLEKALRIFEDIGDRVAIAELYHHAAFLGVSMGDYQKAFEGFIASLEIRQQIGDEAGEGALLVQLGSLAADVLGRNMEGLRLLCAGQLVLDEALAPLRFDVADWILDLAEEMGIPPSEELDDIWYAAYDDYCDAPTSLIEHAFPTDTDWPEPKQPSRFPM